MDLGTGLVVATILAITAWQIDKRSAWRRVRNFALCLVALAVVAAFAFWGYTAQQDRQTRLEAQLEAQKVREGMVRTLAGISLGESKDRLVYAWGDPESDAEGVLSWRNADSQRAVSLDETGRVRVVLCSTSDYSFARQCGKVGGIEIGDSESDVLAALGEPALPPTFNGSEKTMFFGRETGFDLVFKSGVVTRFVLYTPRDKTRMVPKQPSPQAADGPWEDYKR